MNDRAGDVDQKLSEPKPRASQGGHGWMMLGCGIMFATVLAVIAGGVLRTTAVIVALGCIAMMGLMMLMMLMMSRLMGEHDRPDRR